LCCVFSPWLDSLSSAATSVGAKPNHGFFGCQHPGRKFFRDVPGHGRGGEGAVGVASAPMFAARRARCTQCLHESAENKLLFDCASFRARRATCMRIVASNAPEGVREGVCRLSGKGGRTARFRCRACPIAQKCAGSGAPPTTAPGPATRLFRRRRRCLPMPSIALDERRDDPRRMRPAMHAGGVTTSRADGIAHRSTRLDPCRPRTAPPTPGRGNGPPFMRRPIRARRRLRVRANENGRCACTGRRVPRACLLRRRRAQCSSSSSSSA
jgi:hypothetical protein